MKKTSVWLIAIITSLVSLVAMCIFNLILSVVYYFIGKVAFLSEIIDFIGEILDLGLTAIAAVFIAIAIWRFGHAVTEKINGEAIAFRKSPISYINSLFIFVFLAMFIFLGFKFVMLIGEVVVGYTAGLQGVKYLLMLFKAIKDAVLFVCAENMIVYKLGVNALLLSFINIYADKFID